MANIVDLPNELVDKIASHLLPGSIGAFALSCKAIYTKCKYTIEKHHTYREKYRTWTNRGPQRAHVFWFLYEIAKDPLIAEYVEVLSFWDCRPFDDIKRVRQDMGAGWEIWKDEEAIAQVLGMVREKLGAYFDVLFIDMDIWCHGIRRETTPQKNTIRGFISALTLLCLVPNLRELALHPKFPWNYEGLPPSYSKCFITAVVLFCYLEHAPPQLPYRPLEKLETLLPYEPLELEDDEVVQLEYIRPFLGLPNLRNVYSSSGIFEPPFNFQDFDPLPLVTRQLRRLELIAGSLSPEGLQALLQGCTNLEVFRYVHARKSGEIGVHFVAGECIKALGKIAGGSLKELSMRAGLFNWNRSGIQDFKDFNVLESLEVDVALFVADRVDEGSRPKQSLVSMLPGSIRNVTLHSKEEETFHWHAPGLTCRDKIEWFAQMLTGLASAKEDNLDKLEEVVVKHYVIGAGDSVRDTPRRAPDKYSEFCFVMKKFAELEGVKWINEELDPERGEWDGWVREYRERFYAEDFWFSDEDE